MATELDGDFGGDALQKIVAVNGLSIPTTVHSLSVPSCSIVEDVTEGDTVNKTTNIVSCCERTLCVSVWFGWRGQDRAEI